MEWTGLAIFYFACFAFGFVFALIGALFGELGGHFHFDMGGRHIEFGHGDGLSQGVEAGHEIGAGGHEITGVDAGHAMPGANMFNTITIATFLSFFGLAGLLTVWVFHMPAGMSLVLSFPLAVLIAAGQFLLWVKVFVKAQASSEATLSEVLGCQAEVAAGIPGDRVGQITYVIRGSRFTAPAVSSDATDIPRGTQVVIVNVRGTTLVVRPL